MHKATAAPRSNENTAASSTSLPPGVYHDPGILIVIPPTFCELARIGAERRSHGHDSCRKKHQDQGQDRNGLADYFGLLAEAVVVDWLERAGHQPTGLVLYADTPPYGVDFWLDGRAYDIKAVLPGCRYACVNKARHDDPGSRPDEYIIALFVTATAIRLYRASADEVDAWDVRHGHSPYRSAPISSLRPIYHLGDPSGRAQR